MAKASLFATLALTALLFTGRAFGGEVVTDFRQQFDAWEMACHSIKDTGFRRCSLVWDASAHGGVRHNLPVYVAIRSEPPTITISLSDGRRLAPKGAILRGLEGRPVAVKSDTDGVVTMVGKPAATLIAELRDSMALVLRFSTEAPAEEQEVIIPLPSTFADALALQKAQNSQPPAK